MSWLKKQIDKARDEFMSCSPAKRRAFGINERESPILRGCYYITGTAQREREYVTFVSCIRGNGFDDTIAEFYGNTEQESRKLAEIALGALNE